jgi:hypothetical protein
VPNNGSKIIKKKKASFLYLPFYPGYLIVLKVHSKGAIAFRKEKFSHYRVLNSCDLA